VNVQKIIYHAPHAQLESLERSLIDCHQRLPEALAAAAKLLMHLQGQVLTETYIMRHVANGRMAPQTSMPAQWPSLPPIAASTPCQVAKAS